jgi:ABC-2 type transport system permease protein
MALMYLTPLFYPENIIPSKYKILLYLNPLYYYIKSFRFTILYGQMPSLKLISACLLISFTALIVGLFVFYKKQDKFILYV